MTKGSTKKELRAKKRKFSQVELYAFHLLVYCSYWMWKISRSFNPPFHFLTVSQIRIIFMRFFCWWTLQFTKQYINYMRMLNKRRRKTSISMILFLKCNYDNCNLWLVGSGWEKITNVKFTKHAVRENVGVTT